MTALLVVATLVYSFQRFENETAYRRGMAFLVRVVSMYDNIFDMHEQSPEEFQRWLRGLVLYEPDIELYLLDATGLILAKTGPAKLQPGSRVALGPVRESIERMDTSYVMGDDPERMDAGAVIVAKPVHRASARTGAPNAGYLYLVLHAQQLPADRMDVLRSSFARPAMVGVIAVVAFTTLLALLIIAAVTRPLRTLTRAVATLSQRGLAAGLTVAPTSPLPAPTRDEFGQLTRRLRDAARRLPAAVERAAPHRPHPTRRREQPVARPALAAHRHGRLPGDARRPLAAEAGAPADDRRLVEIALRNTRNAAAMVRSLGDLAKLDEPEYRLRPEAVDVGELLDDIVLRFAERAARARRRGAGVAGADAAGSAPPHARIDVELFERAIANLVDNALKFCPRGCTVTLTARRLGTQIEVTVADDGRGSPPPTCRSCSTASIRAAPRSRRPPATAAAAWGWRSSSGSSS